MSYKLYNSIELPDIDTIWTDKATYPYAYMMCTSMTYDDPNDDPQLSCYLVFSSEPLYHKYEKKSVATKYRYLYTKTACSCMQYVYNKVNDLQYGTQWEYQETSEVSADNYAWRTVMGGTYDALWCNVDLYNYDDNTLYLAGEPEPDTPTDPVLSWQGKDAYCVINGAWVKCDALRSTDGKWVKQDSYS